MLGSLLRFDIAARSWVVLHRVGVLDEPIYLLCVVARSGMLWLGVATLLVLMKRFRVRDLASLAIALGLGLIVSDHILKPAFQRPRPFVTSQIAAVIGEPPHDPSFPSGHATTAAIGAVVLTSGLPALGWLWWTIAIAVGYARIYLGVHYPLDVLAGAAVGGMIAVGVLRMLNGVAMTPAQPEPHSPFDRREEPRATGGSP